MTIPYRGHTSQSTYFITSSTWMKAALLQTERTASLLVDVLFHYRASGNYLLHEFVVMPNHFHLLLTPGAVALERCLQLIKGGFSFRAKKEFGLHGPIWQTSFFDRRVRDTEEYERPREYIHQNPVRKALVSVPEEFRYSSAHPGFALDKVPQRLKPSVLEDA